MLPETKRCSRWGRGLERSEKARDIQEARRQRSLELCVTRECIFSLAVIVLVPLDQCFPPGHPLAQSSRPKASWKGCLGERGALGGRSREIGRVPHRPAGGAPLYLPQCQRKGHWSQVWSKPSGHGEGEEEPPLPAPRGSLAEFVLPG